MIVWHGGYPGLRPGEWILPPAETHITFTRALESQRAGFGNISQLRDRIYLAAQRDLARVFAGGWSPDGVAIGYGWLYEVEIDAAELEPDPDLLSMPGISYQAKRAQVSRVWERGVQPNQRRFAQILESTLAAHADALNQQGGAAGVETSS